MNRLSLFIDSLCCNKTEFELYLNQIKGINKSLINLDLEEAYIEYDESIISIKIIKLEVCLFLASIKRTPLIYGFNKYLSGGINSIILSGENICCEYCLISDIDSLLEEESISKIYYDLNGKNKCNTDIELEYCVGIISEEKLKEVIKKLTSL